MNVAGFGAYRFEVPLVAPLSLAGETIRTRRGLLLRLVAEDGSVGWGEASPLPGFSRETLDEAAGQLVALASSVLGKDLDEDSSPSGASPSARFGLETALLGLRGAVRGEALPEALPLVLASRTGRAVQDRFRTSALLAGTRHEVIGGAQRAREAGYGTVKIKVGTRGVDRDAALTRAVDEVFGGGAALRVDPNRAWSFAEAEEFIARLDGLRLEYLEEPLAEPAGLGELVRDTGATVALDESLVGMEPEGLADHAYAGAVVLKPTLLGLEETLRFAQEASRLGTEPVISASYEAGVGTAALVALAASVGGAAAGLDTYRRLADDVVRPRPGPLGPEVDVRAFFSASNKVDVGSLELIRSKGEER